LIEKIALMMAVKKQVCCGANWNVCSLHWKRYDWLFCVLF